VTANPWAAAVFIALLLALHGLGVDSTKPGTFGVLFLGFVPLWILCGMLWDRLTIKACRTEPKQHAN